MKAAAIGRSATLRKGFPLSTQNMPIHSILPRLRGSIAALLLFTWAATMSIAAQTNATLPRDAAESEIQRQWDALVSAERSARVSAIENKRLLVRETFIPWLERRFGEAKEGERSLWISLHGGGGTTKEVNDQQWRNQIRLYAPKEGIVVAPRAPADAWNMWHLDIVDEFLKTLIETYVIAGLVDPNRVHLLGYSAGGDGVYQLAPRMPDRFASAAMMAGHPNETVADGLRNLPFFLFMGGEDRAYDRADKARGFAKDLARRAAEDAGGYPHRATIYEGLGHWMNGKDREALPWMAEKTRAAWPKKLLWRQDDVRHERFYWLQLLESGTPDRELITARIDENAIHLQAPSKTKLRLNLRDELLDLDQSITVLLNGKTVYSGVLERTKEAIAAALAVRKDPVLAATAQLELESAP